MSRSPSFCKMTPLRPSRHRESAFAPLRTFPSLREMTSLRRRESFFAPLRSFPSLREMISRPRRENFFAPLRSFPSLREMTSLRRRENFFAPLRTFPSLREMISRPRHESLLKSKIFAFILILQFFFVIAKAQEFYPIWPSGKKPNWNGRAVTDSLYNERFWRVATPGIYAFPVPRSENKGTTVMICPGGGYEHLSHIYNGFQFARWFNAHGINAFVLLYRLPDQQDLQQHELAPSQDAQRGMRFLRANASKWGLDPNKIGVMGISAGGHVATTIGTHFEDVSAIGDSLDKKNYVPDFMILLSPVITMGKYANKSSRKNFLRGDTTAAMIAKYSNELQVSSRTPPGFIVHAQNDSTVPVKNSLLFYNALVENKVSASIHIFPQGGHNIKLVDNPGSTDLWLDLLVMWLNENRFIAPINKK
jgi:acetyl esterase/lipase